MAGPPYRADESSQPNSALEQRVACEHALRREPGSPLGGRRRAGFALAAAEECLR